MMMEVLLEEDQPSDTEFPLRDELVAEQALKLFRICDENEKGFIVKADLAKIDGFINEMPIEKLESFFDNIDTSKTNIVTESQFIDNIKPILSRMEKGESISKCIQNAAEKSKREIVVRPLLQTDL
ncbi:unnamed protein product [Enterobius vermicularis]|uniref:EF-hand domain-containing protein n=1 Tax=Enterobius vermicularis TaxID=51028 RepID=A0A0N4VK74_ENTVE|nr:unnamed protein product [Enterobius vermicularis]